MSAFFTYASVICAVAMVIDTSATADHGDHDYDFIVIGSATGGVVAARLAEAKYRVLLIEAGPDDATYSCTDCNALPNGDLVQGTIAVPQTFDWYRNVRDLNWQNTRSMPAFYNYNKTILGKAGGMMRAKMLGGCLSHNGNQYDIGSSRDYDFVAQNLSLPDWSWQNVWPFFEKLERYLGENRTGRGQTGPITLTQTKIENWQWKLAAFLQTANDSGLPFYPQKYQGLSRFGLNMNERNVAKYTNGTLGAFNSSYYRESSSNAYIRSIGLPSGYLTVWQNTTVQRILFDHDNKTQPRSQPKAVGVQFFTNENEDTLESVYCNKEVIVSAGAYKSPQLLMLSGIGPLDELDKFNISATNHIEGHERVGRYGQDHVYYTSFSYRMNLTMLDYDRNLTEPNVTSVWIPAENRRQYFDIMAGVVSVWLSTGTFDRLGYDYTDIRLECFNGGPPWNLDPSANFDDLLRCFMDSAVNSKNLTVQLQTLDARQFPAVYQEFFADSSDYDVLINGIQEARKIFQHNESLFVEELYPGTKLSTEQLLEDIYQKSSGSLHAVGTVGMGPSDEYPVDTRCAVRGVHGLRVVDASIWPYSTCSGNMALVFMLGEKCAHHIIADYEEGDEDEQTWWQRNGITVGIVSAVICVLAILMIAAVRCAQNMKEKRNDRKEDELTLLNKK